MGSAGMRMQRITARRPIPSCNGPGVTHMLQSRVREITRGFQGRRSPSESKRLPPGQHLTRDFPVLSAAPTPHTPLDAWTFALEAENGEQIVSWSWEEFRALGPTEVTVDIHCVTRWSKFETDWRGISVDRIFAAAGLDEPPSP